MEGFRAGFGGWVVDGRVKRGLQGKPGTVVAGKCSRGRRRGGGVPQGGLDGETCMLKEEERYNGCPSCDTGKTRCKRCPSKDRGTRPGG